MHHEVPFRDDAISLYHNKSKSFKLKLKKEL